jgi:hypothetical protein
MFAIWWGIGEDLRAFVGVNWGDVGVNWGDVGVWKVGGAAV